MTDPPLRYIEVPHEQIPDETLDRLLESVALRDDTDYSDTPVSLPRRIAMARAALVRGELVVVFDPETETATVLPRRSLPPDTDPSEASYAMEASDDAPARDPDHD